MLKVLTVVLLVFGLFLLTNTISAQTKTREEITQERLNAKKLKMEQRMLEKQRLLLQKQEQKIQVREQMKATQEARLTEIKQENIKRHYTNMHNKFLAMIERLETLAGRIEARIAVIEETENVNLTNAKSEIARAKTLLDEAKADLAAVDNTIDQTLEASDPKGAFSVIRDSLGDIKKKLVEVHRILVKIIGEVKGLRIGNTKTVSPTASPTTAVQLTPTVTPTL